MTTYCVGLRRTALIALSFLMSIAASGCGGGGGGSSTSSNSTSSSSQESAPFPNNGNGNSSADPILQLSWQPNTDEIAGYIVAYGATDATATTTASTLALGSNGFNAQSPSVSYYAGRDLNLAAGDSVCFRLRAYNSSNTVSDWSPAICGTI